MSLVRGILVLAVSFSVLACGPLPLALAESSPAKPAPVKRPSVDANEDGKVSLEEAKKSAQLQFTAFDQDKNAKISREEFLSRMTLIGPKDKKPTKDQIKAARKVMIGRFTELDTSKDKTLSSSEIEADSVARHKAMDGNGDGLVTKEEIAAVREKARKARARQIEDLKNKIADDKKKTAP